MQKTSTKKSPWIRDAEEDLEIKARSLMLSKNEFFKTYILIQYIWYQNITLKPSITEETTTSRGRF
ncbi:unnamed protein product, partial [Brassica oleracea]